MTKTAHNKKALPWLAIAALSLLAWPRHWAGADLYSDDWFFLAQADLLGKLLDGSYYSRPLQFAIFPATYWLVEHAPCVIPVLLFFLGVLEAGLLGLFLRPTLGTSGAFVASCAVLVCPARAVVHYWTSNASQLLSHCLALGAMLALRDGRNWAARGLNLACGLVYESAMLAPVLLGGKGSWRVLGPVLAVLLAWQWGGTRLIGQANAKSVAPSVAHAVNVYRLAAWDLMTAPVRGLR